MLGSLGASTVPAPTGYSLSLAAAASPMANGGVSKGNIRDVAGKSSPVACSGSGVATKQQLNVATRLNGDVKSRLKKVATRKISASSKGKGVKDLYDYTLEDIIR